VKPPGPPGLFPAPVTSRRYLLSGMACAHCPLAHNKRAMTEYDYLVLYLPRGTSRDAARRVLTDHAEYGDWELARLRLFADGSRKATLRRRIIRAVRTF